MRNRICWTLLWVGLTVSLTMQFFAFRRMDRLEDTLATIPERIVWKPGTGVGIERRNADGIKRFPDC